MKKIFALFFICASVFLCGCYDASEIEETAYLIALGIDSTGEEGGYQYTFQLAAPLAISGGGGEEGGGGSSDGGSENKTVKNVLIGAPDFYTAKNMLTNYLSKSLNMSHLKLIVCSEDFAQNSLKKHAELFLQEREIRPGTFVALSDGKAEEFLKAVNPDLEGSTSKYYELSNSEKTLIYAPSVRLSDFLNSSENFDKSAVLPLALTSDKESADEFNVEEDDSGIKNSSQNRVSDSKAELYGMGIFKDGVLKGKMSGDEALFYNILTGSEKRFTFSVTDKKNEGEVISFDVQVLKKPDFIISEFENSLNITAELLLNMEYIGAAPPPGYKNNEEILSVGEETLKNEINAFLLKTSREFSADILKTERLYKTRFLTLEDFEKSSYEEKYKNAVFYTDIKRSNKSKSTLSGDID